MHNFYTPPNFCIQAVCEHYLIAQEDGSTKKSYSFLLVCLIQGRIKEMNSITLQGTGDFKTRWWQLSDNCHSYFTKAGRNSEPCPQGHTKKYMPVPRL